MVLGPNGVTLPFMVCVCVVMSWDTGRVLDTVVLSKYCGKCQAKLRALGLNEDQGGTSSIRTSAH